MKYKTGAEAQTARLAPECVATELATRPVAAAVRYQRTGEQRHLGRLGVQRTRLRQHQRRYRRNAYNKAGAPSQYDVACFQVNQPPP